jgi:membrane protease YdiL (CAAX protease family)
VSAATESQQHPSSSSLRRLVARHPVAAFLLIAYAISWTIFLPVVLQGRGLLAVPVALSEGFAFNTVTSLASILGLALPAFLVTAVTSGEAGVRNLLRRCLRWRVGVSWYLIALFGLLVATLLVASVFLGLAPLGALVEKWPLLFTLFLPEVLLPFVFIQIFEETAWTGFMQHTLQERRGPLVASILVAPAFILMHLPLLLLDAGIELALLIILGAGVILAVFFRIVIMWLYNSTGRSVLIVALFHSAYNSAVSFGDQEFTGELIYGSATVYAVGALVALAMLVAVLSRGHLAYESKDAAPRSALPSTGARQQGGSK